MLEPTTVTLWLPVTAPLVAITADDIGAANVNTVVNVRGSTATSNVTPTDRVRIVPSDALVAIDVDDVHMVDSVALTEMRVARLVDWPATFLPTIVTLMPAVPTVFVNTTELAMVAYEVNTSDNVPTWDCTVATTAEALAVCIAADVLQTTLLSDTQDVT